MDAIDQAFSKASSEEREIVRQIWRNLNAKVPDYTQEEFVNQCFNPALASFLLSVPRRAGHITLRRLIAEQKGGTDEQAENH